MKIVIAPDSFKGSLTSSEVADCIEIGLQRVFPDAEICKVPVSDGGDGFVTALLSNFKSANYFEAQVVNPIGTPIIARFAFIDTKTAVLDIASASGLDLLESKQYDPMISSTYGTGMLIKEAIGRGASTIILGLGGSATNDAGIGLLQALGFNLLNDSGKEVGLGGRSLSAIHTVNCDNVPCEVKATQFILATDVNNILLGPGGATMVFGPQKGASPAMLKDLEAGMENWDKRVSTFSGKQLATTPGVGAAGGTAYTMMSFLRSKIVSGLELFFDFIGFDNLISEADLVVTGEGRLDGQSQFGKVPVGVARRVKQTGQIPVVAINGSIDGENSWVYDNGLDAVFSCIQGVTELENAIRNARNSLIIAAERAARALAINITTVNQDLKGITYEK